jgi:hypothetical protein
MNFRSLLLGGGAILFPLAGTLPAESPATNTPPGPVQAPEMTNAEPQTPAPPQANAKAAPGAASPNGSNGTTLSGTPVTKAPNTPPKVVKNPAAAPATASAAPAKNPPAATKPASPVLGNYLKDLDDTLKLSAEEKKDIETYYLADGVELKNLLNDSSLSPLQQAQQVSVLRDQRDDKIANLLADLDRRREFFQVEAKYRVALTEAAADGALVPAQTPAPAPAPTGAAPGQAGGVAK